MPLPATILQAGVLGAFKSWITPGQVIADLQSAASPALKLFKPVPAGGTDYPMPMLVSTGGNISGDAIVSQAAAAAGNKSVVVKPAIPPAHIFSSFELNPYDAEASARDPGAFEKFGKVQYAGAIDMMRKGLAAVIYGMGYHEVGQVVANASAGDAFIIVQPETEIKIDVGTPINIMASDDIQGAVTAAAITGCPYYVLSSNEMGDGTYKIKLATSAGVATTLSAAVTAGYWIFVDGGLTAAGLGYVPNGLASIIPYYKNRSGTAWDTYITTSFYGVNRSTAVTKQAGIYLERQSGESLTAFYMRALMKAKRARNYNPKLLINDRNYLEMLADANSHLAYYSQLQGKTGGNKFSMGGKILEVVYDDLKTQDVIPDPYCPYGYAWIIDESTWIMPSLTDIGQATSGVDGFNKGENMIPGAKEPPMNISVLADRWISTYECATHEGPGVGVMLCGYLNFGCTHPSQNLVLNLAEVA